MRAHYRRERKTMLQFKTIVVPTDFSDQSQVGLNYAIALARQFGSTIHCVHVIDQRYLEGGGGDAIYVPAGNAQETLRGIREHALKRLAHQTKKAEAFQLKAEAHVREGRPVDEIQTIAKELKADLIVVATHGRSGLDHMLLGSTTEKLLRKAAVPVLTVRPTTHGGLHADVETLDIKKILVPLDFSDFSHKALPTAIEFAKTFGSTLVLVHVVDSWLDYPEWGPAVEMNNSPHLIKAADEQLTRVVAELQGHTAEHHVLSGVPHRALDDFVKAQNIDLTIMTTHGRSGIAHFLLGSVTEKVVRTSPSPVLVLHPEGE